MAILVSGGAGYIGSHTCVELLAAGYDIVVADNYYNSCPEALAPRQEDCRQGLPLCHEADMTDKATAVDEDVLLRTRTLTAVIQFAGLQGRGRERCQARWSTTPTTWTAR